MPDAFRPVGTVSIAATTSSVAAVIPVFTAGPFQLEIQNPGDATAFVRWGSGTPTAVVTDYPVLPGQSKIVTVDQPTTGVAAITASGTTTLYVTYGVGV